MNISGCCGVFLFLFLGNGKTHLFGVVPGVLPCITMMMMGE